MSGFGRFSEHHISSIGVHLLGWEHPCGAKHYHLASEDSENVFMVGFRTVPRDSTGVAHILEHTVLCGSQRYPVRDPFFLMLRRSLNTFMNAFTASDWTAYPFASCNKKDFFNLLDVYLDAVFFPNLDVLDFCQEGWRYDFAEEGNMHSDLVYKGVVYNEMKGAMSSQTRVLWQALSEHLFPTVTYRHNSGGDPSAIPDLTHQQLVEFHRQHYHPANAVFLTYGNNDPAAIQRQIEARVLSAFGHCEPLSLIPLEQRFSASVHARGRYALDEEDLAGRTHIVGGWLWGDASDIDELLQAHLLTSVLLDNSSSPLRRALETSALGRAPSPACGLESDQREMVFCAGLEGSDPEHAAAVEALMQEIFQTIVREGVDGNLVEAALHQLELDQREIRSSGHPYGLNLALSALIAAVHGADVKARIDIESALEALRDRCRDPRFIPNLVQRWLVENTHRIALCLTPDNRLSRQRREDEQERLRRVEDQLDSRKRKDIAAVNEELKRRQGQEQDVDSLPRVGIEDVEEISAGVKALQGSQGSIYQVRTNGLFYFSQAFALPKLGVDDLLLLPLLTSFIGELRTARHRSYAELQAEIARYSGGIGTGASLISAPDDVDDMYLRVGIGGKGLARHHSQVLGLMDAIRDESCFDEDQRVAELIDQWALQAERDMLEQGHLLAMNAAASTLSAAASVTYHWQGIKGIQRLLCLQQSWAASRAELVEKCRDLYQRIFAGRTPDYELLIADQKSLTAINTSVRPVNASAPPRQVDIPPPDHSQSRVAWSTSTEVNYCACAYTAVPVDHPDAAALLVLAHFLRNGYLHTAIREQGGAYGGGAQYDAGSASFRFYSYRDPRLQETFADFSASLAWLCDRKHEDRQLEEAILNVIARIDAPLTPAGEARREFFGQLDGCDHEWRSRHRERVLSVRASDLQRVAARYLSGDPAQAVICSAREAERLTEQGYIHQAVREK